jgi:hypothetical protein
MPVSSCIPHGLIFEALCQPVSHLPSDTFHCVMSFLKCDGLQPATEKALREKYTNYFFNVSISHYKRQYIVIEEHWKIFKNLNSCNTTTQR